MSYSLNWMEIMYSHSCMTIKDDAVDTIRWMLGDLIKRVVQSNGKRISEAKVELDKEALHFWKNYVYILAKGCARFRNQFLKEKGMEPFSCITIASACMNVFLINLFPPETLAVPAPYDYKRQCKRYSHTSIQWGVQSKHLYPKSKIRNARAHTMRRPEHWWQSGCVSN